MKKIKKQSKFCKWISKLFAGGKKRMENRGKYIKDDIEHYNSKEKKPILYVRNLTKKYFGRRLPAIKNIGFDVYPGEFHAFIGGNGAGKTTTIKSLIGAYSNWSGTILINGIRNSNEHAKAKIGYIPESARFPDKFSAFKYLEWMVMLSGIHHRDAARIATDKLKEFNMWNLRNKSPNGFSSGQKKKILLAQALIHDPDIIIMDEPVANLDPRARGEFFEMLNQLKKKGKAIFISSHVLAELEIYFDSATILDGGKIVFTGSKETLEKSFPKSNYTINVKEWEKLEAYFKKTKIRHDLDEISKQFVVHVHEAEKIKKIQKFIVDSKMTMSLFSINRPTLEQIYRKLIVKGSVDTMKK